MSYPKGSRLTTALSNSIVDGLKTSKEKAMEKLMRTLKLAYNVSENTCLRCHQNSGFILLNLRNFLKEKQLLEKFVENSNGKFDYDGKYLGITEGTECFNFGEIIETFKILKNI